MQVSIGRWFKSGPEDVLNHATFGYHACRPISPITLPFHEVPCGSMSWTVPYHVIKSACHAMPCYAMQCKKSGVTMLNPQNKCTRSRQNKISKCSHKLFFFFNFANGGTNNVIRSVQCLTLQCTVFTPLKARAGRKLLLSAQAAVQTAIQAD